MIQLANQDDLLSIEPMLEALDRLHVKHLPERFTPRDTLERLQRLQTILEKQGFILYEESKGFITVEWIGNKRYRIEYLFVRPEGRRVGLATALLRTAEEHLQGMDLYVSAYCFNKEAISLYDQLYQRSSVVYHKSINVDE